MVRLRIYLLSILTSMIALGSNGALGQERPGRGAVPPPNLEELVRSQHKINEETRSLRAYSARRKPPRPYCSEQMRAFDWARHGKVSEVRDQGACGSCWAFAAVAAYEASYLIENGLNARAPDGPNTSEQQSLDCAKSACNGGWHTEVFDYLRATGETTRPKYSTPAYTAKKGLCRNVPAREYRVLQWGFVTKQFTIPNNQEIKKAICEHGPIVAAVLADDWDHRLPNSTKFAYSSTQNPNWLRDYPNGVFKGTPSKNLPHNKIDHDIVIVGWDDGVGAWIIKNSWGVAWGHHGYMKLAYETANIGFNATWVEAVHVASPDHHHLLSAIEEIHRKHRK
jgi:cathepsin L